MSKKSLFWGTGIFVLAFILRAIKAGWFPLNHDEMITVDASASFRSAIEQSHSDLVPPFLNVINVIFQKFGHGSIFWQRFPMILAGALAVLLCYQILIYFKFRQPILLILIPATSFILVFYSQELRFYSYILLLTLATFYWGWKTFVEGKVYTWEVLILAACFLLLPIIHYFTFFHLLALDITLFIFILIFASSKIRKLFALFLANVFSFLILIPWADAFARNLNEAKDTSSLGKLTRLDWDLIKNIFYKFTGGADWWSIFILLILIGGLILLLVRLFKHWPKDVKQSPDAFVLFCVGYLVVFLLTFSNFSFGRFLAWRYLIYLVWPFLMVIFYSLSCLLAGKRVLYFAGLTLVGAILISNLLNTTAYLLSPNRFNDSRSLADMIKSQVNSGQKKRVIIHNFGCLYCINFYLKNPNFPIEPISNPAVAIGPIDRMKEQLTCCSKDIIYIHIREKESKSIGETQANKTIEEMADQVYTHKQVVGQSKYLDFLNQRKVDPYYGYPYEFGGYLPPIVYW